MWAKIEILRGVSMIIRSQDKTVIVNFNMQSEIYVSEGIGGFGIETNEFILGDYSTEEKAIKVLDMIQKAYNTIENMKIDKQAWRDNHYFEMPLDADVEV